MTKKVIVRIFPLLLMLVAVMPLRAQSDDCDDTYLQAINSALDEGDCKGARRFYNAYKECRKGRTSSDIERRIAECEKSTTGGNSTTGTRGSNERKNLTFEVKGVKFTMVYVEGGTYMMGAQKSDPAGANYDPEAQDYESPVHRVSVDNFYMGQTEVTQALWKTVMGDNPSYFNGENLPVEMVSWDDVQEFIKKLNQMTGRTFRLPTEAEWEYAARGGESTSLYTGENIRISGVINSPNLDKLAWYGGNCGQDYTYRAGCDVSKGWDISDWDEKQYNDSKGGTHPVGLKQPNRYGLYDMLGNVWEWCSDWFGKDYYSNGFQTNPKGPSLGSYRVIRGGSWDSYACCCRVADRCYISPDYRDQYIGFRLVLVQ